ncbi:MAG TPA: hypothetical protein VFQ80_02305 [Thermomicrobiales bacterium]|nr:hypothetical protein [Thermomicrobiales bacterium]
MNIVGSVRSIGLTFRRDAVWAPRPEFAPAALAIGALALWAMSLRAIRIDRIDDLGLISALPAPFFAALVMLTVGYCWALRQRPLSVPLLAIMVVFLIVMLYGVASFVEGMPRYHSVWKHFGVIDYIQRTGQVNPRIDAYFNWPGFFILFAFIADIAGLQDWPRFANWIPVFLNLIYLGPLLMVLRAGTKDKRLIWLAIWLFYLTNWIQQDYFSPQGFNYFFYLVIIAILVTWFKIGLDAPHPILKRLGVLACIERVPRKLRAWLTPTDGETMAIEPWRRRGLLAIVMAVYVTVVASHQLTPFAVLGSVTLLVVFSRTSARWLPVAMVIVAALWIQYMSVAYMAGHGEELVSQVGNVSEAVGANAGSRFAGSQGHMIVVYMRSLMTVALWGLAFLGVIRRLRHGHRDLTFALLAAAPFPLLILQPYGGEMALRVYFFALPFMAFFAAALVYPTPTVGASARATGVIGVLSAALLVAFFITRYGNEKMDYATQSELDAANYIYRVAPPGSLFLVGTANTAWRYRDYEKYSYRTLTNELLWRDGPIERNVDEIARIMDSQRYPATYLLITGSQTANDDLFYLFPVPLSDLEQAMIDSHEFTEVYSNGNAHVFTVNKSPIGPPP